MGNDDETPMHRVTGGKYPAMLWRDYMNGAIGVDVPRFARENYDEAGETAGDTAPSGGGFSDMLMRWSSEFVETAPPVKPDGNPVYNR